MQEQAEADRNGVWVPEEVVWVTDRAEQKASEGSRGTEGHEGGATHRHFSTLLWATTSLHINHVSPLWARHHHRRQTAFRRRHFVR